ncbi:MAG TPA: penicillin-binding transpeptidase domain-containing protein, partial [Mobilitalea sp.]|nr:penicillin-binding transpeptidase domain-containing protein [Mobilitalea sp.]
MSLLLVGLMVRLIYIMQTDGDRYAKQVLSRQSYVSAVLPYERGEILDRKGTILAKSVLQYRLILDPKQLLMNEEDITPTMNALKQSFGIKPEDVQSILKDRPDSQYVILLKNIKQDAVDKYKQLTKYSSDITGIYFEEEYVRDYPYDTLASDVIGFTSADGTGHWGLEEYYNDELNGTNGREYGYYDSSLNIEKIVKKPENGNSLVSTIDANVQRIVQKHIKAFNEETGSKNIGVVVMNPNNGEILAMASDQDYNLNDPRNLSGIYTPEELSSMTEAQKSEALNKLWKNECISFGYEPGSTFKPFTISAGLEENVIAPDQVFH